MRLPLGATGFDGVPVEFFNAREGATEVARRALSERVARQRRRYAELIDSLARDVDQLIANLNDQVSVVFEQVERQLWTWISANREFYWGPAQVQQSLLGAIEKTHPATLNVIVGCRGEYGELDYYHHLGFGARRIAVKLIGEGKVKQFKVVVKNQLDNREFSTAHDFLRRLLEALDSQVEGAYGRIYSRGRTAFRRELGGDDEFWRKCMNRWGKGRGYRDDIRDWTDEQFDSSYDDSHRTLRAAISEEWAKVVSFLEKTVKHEAQKARVGTR
jgi:hypothetical protein